MHQDGEYWPIRPLKTVTVWVALDRLGARGAAVRARCWQVGQGERLPPSGAKVSWLELAAQSL